jgi:SPP1 family predicted phage head-tail adaptor
MLANIERWFTETWEVYRLSTIDDAWGNPVEEWVLSHEVEGRFRPLSGERRLSADKQTEFADAKFYCAIDADIETGDRLVGNGQIYDVKIPLNLMSMDRFLQVELKLRDV